MDALFLVHCWGAHVSKAQKLNPRVFVIDFSDASDAKQQGKGANAVDPISKFSKTISLLVSAASSYDEVVVRATYRTVQKFSPLYPRTCF